MPKIYTYKYQFSINEEISSGLVKIAMFMPQRNLVISLEQLTSNNISYNFLNFFYFFIKSKFCPSFKTVKITDEDSNVFNIPSNLKKFLYDYAHSTFEECNAEMALTISQSQKQNKDKNERFIKQMRYVTEKLESLNLHYWLSCGSLLG